MDAYAKLIEQLGDLTREQELENKLKEHRILIKKIMEIIKINPALNPVVTILEEKQKKDKDELEELRLQALDELSDLYNTLETYCIKCRINMPQMSFPFNCFDEQNNLVETNPIAVSQEIEFILNELYKKYPIYRNFLKEFIKQQRQNNLRYVLEVICTSHYDAWYEKSKEIETKEAWNSYKLLMNYEETGFKHISGLGIPDIKAMPNDQDTKNILMVRRPSELNIFKEHATKLFEFTKKALCNSTIKTTIPEYSKNNIILNTTQNYQETNISYIYSHSMFQNASTSDKASNTDLSKENKKQDILFYGYKDDGQRLGTLYYGKESEDFFGNSAALLNLLVKEKSVYADVATDVMPEGGKATPIKQVKNARNTVNKKAAQKLGIKKLIRSENGKMSLTQPIEYKQ